MMVKEDVLQKQGQQKTCMVSAILDVYDFPLQKMKADLFTCICYNWFAYMETFEKYVFCILLGCY